MEDSDEMPPPADEEPDMLVLTEKRTNQQRNQNQFKENARAIRPGYFDSYMRLPQFKRQESKSDEYNTDSERSSQRRYIRPGYFDSYLVVPQPGLYRRKVMKDTILSSIYKR